MLIEYLPTTKEYASCTIPPPYPPESTTAATKHSKLNTIDPTTSSQGKQPVSPYNCPYHKNNIICASLAKIITFVFHAKVNIIRRPMLRPRSQKSEKGKEVCPIEKKRKRLG
jgi:hypothetical protein